VKSIVKFIKSPGIIRLFAISLALTLITHPGIWIALANGYPEDHLFNLSNIQITGLIVITGVMAILLFLTCTSLSDLLCKWAGKYLARWQLTLSCIALALLLSAIALAIVPQLHYLYYQLIIPDLPAQWVPIGDLSLDRLLRYFLLRADDITTVHAKGVTVWVCVFGSALTVFRQSTTNCANSLKRIYK